MRSLFIVALYCLFIGYKLALAIPTGTNSEAIEGDPHGKSKRVERMMHRNREKSYRQEYEEGMHRVDPRYASRPHEMMESGRAPYIDAHPRRPGEPIVSQVWGQNDYDGRMARHGGRNEHDEPPSSSSKYPQKIKEKGKRVGRVAGHVLEEVAKAEKANKSKSRKGGIRFRSDGHSSDSSDGDSKNENSRNEDSRNSELSPGETRVSTKAASWLCGLGLCGGESSSSTIANTAQNAPNIPQRPNTVVLSGYDSDGCSNCVGCCDGFDLNLGSP